MEENMPLEQQQDEPQPIEPIELRTPESVEQCLSVTSISRTPLFIPFAFPASSNPGTPEMMDLGDMLPAPASPLVGPSEAIPEADLIQAQNIQGSRTLGDPEEAGTAQADTSDISWTAPLALREASPLGDPNPATDTPEYQSIAPRTFDDICNALYSRLNEDSSSIDFEKYFETHGPLPNYEMCTMCPGLFTSRADLDMHIYKEHNEGVPFVCPVVCCVWQTKGDSRESRKQSLSRHLRQMHDMNLEEFVPGYILDGSLTFTDSEPQLEPQVQVPQTGNNHPDSHDSGFRDQL